MNVSILQLELEETGTIETLCQSTIVKAELAMERAGHADLFILPELFTTGGFLPLTTWHKNCTEGNDMQAFSKSVANVNKAGLQWMKEKSHATGAAICGSMVCQEGEAYYNRLYFVEPDGKTTTYDKHHLFRGAGEEKLFTAGSQRVIVTFCGMRILLQVCYDLRFPVFSRNRNDYDAIIYVANWPAGRLNAWETLLCARAIENQCYVMGANCCGSDSMTTYAGCSIIYDPYGHCLAKGSGTEADCVGSTLKTDLTEAFRKKFPAQADADEFTLKGLS